jgi:hypothetical protein
MNYCFQGKVGNLHLRTLPEVCSAFLKKFTNFHDISKKKEERKLRIFNIVSGHLG